MPLSIVRNDITTMNVDAIVNAANNTLLGGGGVDGCIHRAAGPQLLEECRTLNGCQTGQAKITAGYNLPAKYVIHTVGPIWMGGCNGEEKELRSCYRESLNLALEHHCESVAFPLISAGVYGYPKSQAFRIAVEEISAFLLAQEMLVYIVIFDKTSFFIGEKLFADIRQYIDDNYVELHTDDYAERMRRVDAAKTSVRYNMVQEKAVAYAAISSAVDTAPKTVGKLNKSDSLESMLSEIDESFSQMLLRKIDEKGIKDSECYKRANVDRKLFSKIRNDVYYKPKKTTVIAFAVALELSLEETKEILRKAGFALSRSSKFDIIVEYFVSRGNYNIQEINEVLFAFDQVLLGV